MNQAFDVKNKEDFEANSQLIVEKILVIEKDLSLKPTLSQLMKLTKLHRNTLRNRVWPKQELDRINLDRKTQQNRHIETSNKSESPIIILEKKLDNAKTELVHWFNQVLDLKESLRQLEVNSNHMTEARNYYKRKYEEECSHTKELENNIIHLNDIINMKD